MGNINYPTQEDINKIKAAGYKIISLENTGNGIMDSCKEGTYDDPDAMILDEKNKTATLLFL